MNTGPTTNSSVLFTNLFHEFWGVEQTSYCFFLVCQLKKKYDKYLLKKFVDSDSILAKLSDEFVTSPISELISGLDLHFNFVTGWTTYLARSQFLLSLRRPFLSKNYKIVILMPTVRIFTNTNVHILYYHLLSRYLTYTNSSSSKV